MTKQNVVKLHTCNNDLNQRWYIAVTYNAADGSRKRKQVYLGLNFSKTISTRTKEGTRLVAFVKHQLQLGWNPELCSIEDFMTGAYQESYTSVMSFKKAIDFALEKGKPSWSKATYYGYRLTGKAFQNAAKKIGLANTDVATIKRRDIKLLLETAAVSQKRKWSNKSVNKNLTYLKAIMSKLIEYEFMETNPCTHIKNLPEVEAKHFEPLTPDEKKIISESLILKHYRFYVYLMTIYYTGIRPKEVLALKIKDVHLDKRTIEIIPDLDEENSKTKKQRSVPITENLYSFLKQLEIENENPNYYLFGTPSQNKLGETLRRHVAASKEIYFMPSPFKIKRNTASLLWKKLVMNPENKGGLGINKHMYGMKHTGADDYILAGANIEALKSMFGHSSLLMTERYISKLKDVYKEEIRKHSPKF